MCLIFMLIFVIYVMFCIVDIRKFWFNNCPFRQQILATTLEELHNVSVYRVVTVFQFINGNLTNNSLQ